VGTPIQGSLAASDCRLNDSPADVYRLVVPTVQNVTISVTSSTFGPRLSVQGGEPLAELYGDVPTGNTATVARILAAGTYYVVANGRTPTSAGAYTVSVTTSPLVVCSVASAISTITPAAGAGTTITGSLAPTDCALSDGTLADVYKLTVTGTVNLQIDLSSTSFDAYLFLTTSAFSTIVDDDDSGGGTNARIVRSLTAGTYYIVANAFDVGAQGAYSLTVKIP
jgi:hypothetical protein